MTAKDASTTRLGPSPQLEKEDGLNVESYDFQGNQLSASQLGQLGNIGLRLAELISVELSRLLPGSVETIFRALEEKSFDEVALTVPTFVSVLPFQINQEHGGLYSDSNLSFALIHRRLGGTGARLGEERTLTDIEISLLKPLLDACLSCLFKCWQEFFKIDVSNRSLNLIHHLPQNLSQRVKLAVVTLELILGEQKGFLYLYVPSKLMTKVESPLDKDLAVEINHDETRQLAESMNRVAFDVGADVLGSTISVEDFLNLEVGDMIQLSTKPSDPTLLTVNGVPKFLGQVMIANNLRSFQIHEPLDSIQ